ncbi:(bacterio)chlorophyll synthase [Chlorobium sp. N1]|uniref:(bacterio)chlorophyll synthase n=1 Tax=Chlorobium sp. N1 TaxID=2491138 RepID=UPI00103AE8C3|nr:(bacterio)chlorophyll synthase [Chlorobium sp. N1]TCD47818.1 bacteriochlorophyll c synthase [Chlorobium sp. N1]
MPSTPGTGFINKVRAHIELLDPVTWISVFPSLAAGAMASGQMHATPHDFFILLLLFLMFGPLGTGFSQAINDYYDLELDRVNEPGRPIPSGRLSEKEAVWNSIAVFTLALSSGIWLWLHFGGVRGAIALTAIGISLVLAYIYSAPPFKLKQNILLSAPAVGIAYNMLPFLAGNALFSDIHPETLWMAGLNFFMGVALIIMNDFKSAKGDLESGLKSMTVMIGAKNTFLVAFVLIDGVFLGFSWIAWHLGSMLLFSIVLVTLAVNMVIQALLYRDPKGGLSFMQHAVDDGFGNAIGKSDVQEHNTFLRYQVANNLLFLIILFIAAGMVGVKYMYQ